METKIVLCPDCVKKYDDFIRDGGFPWTFREGCGGRRCDDGMLRVIQVCGEWVDEDGKAVVDPVEVPSDWEER